MHNIQQKTGKGSSNWNAAFNIDISNDGCAFNATSCETIWCEKGLLYFRLWDNCVYFLLVFNTTNHLFLFNFTVFQKCYKRSDLGRIETKHQTFSILHFRALATKTCQLKNVFRVENVDKLYTVSSLQSTHWYFTVHFLFCDLLVIHCFLWADRGPKIWIGQPQWIYSISFSCSEALFSAGGPLSEAGQYILHNYPVFPSISRECDYTMHIKWNHEM